MRVMAIGLQNFVVTKYQTKDLTSVIYSCTIVIFYSAVVFPHFYLVYCFTLVNSLVAGIQLFNTIALWSYKNEGGIREIQHVYMHRVGVTVS